MRMVNLIEARKALDDVMKTLENITTMAVEEKEALEKETSSFTIKYVLQGDIARITRTRGIIESFVEQISDLGYIMIENINGTKESYVDKDTGIRYNFDALYEISRSERTIPVIEFTHDSVCNFGLQCTHIDADGFGSLLPLTIANSLQSGSDGYQKYVFHIECPNGTSDECIMIGINLIRDIYDNAKGIPNPLLITDVPIEIPTYDLLKELGYTWVDNFTTESMYGYERCGKREYNAGTGLITNKCYVDWNYDVNEAMLIDHHVTNPFYVDYKKNGTPLPVGIYVCPTLGELKTLKGVTIPEELEFKSVIEANGFDIDKLKISATYIAEVILNSFVDELLTDDEIYINGDEDDYLDYRERYHQICQAISQWDTFEWRDHSEYNPENLDPKWIGCMGFDTPILQEMKKILYDIWDENTNIAMDCDCREIIDSNYVDYWSSTDSALHLLSEVLMDSSAIVSSENLGIDAKKLNCPDTWIAAPFPTIGNASLVAHYMMLLDEYKDLRKDVTVGIIMFDPISTTISFRTNETSVSVNELAKHYNGGGHPQASGCKDPIFASSLKLYLQKIAAYRKDTKNHPKMELVIM